jgi:undecaprenyl diphosphate synthase
MEAQVIPQHVAIIMDGNGRWAAKRRLPRVEGHRQGTKTVREIVKEARKLGVKYLTLYVFSNENWGRPGEEVSALMGLFERYLQSELTLMVENGVRLRAMGQLDRLPGKVHEILKSTEAKTVDFDGMQLILAVSYGSRQEIVSAVTEIANKIKAGQLDPSDISEQTISNHMLLPDVPDPDLLIRTSGEMRISNFMLWQLAYTEIVVTECFWPDFSPELFRDCISDYAKRERRFGLTSDQTKKVLSVG